jgi:hypothetical protein
MLRTAAHDVTNTEPPRASALVRNCSHVIDQAYVIAHIHTKRSSL